MQFLLYLRRKRMRRRHFCPVAIFWIGLFFIGSVTRQPAVLVVAFSLASVNSRLRRNCHGSYNDSLSSPSSSPSSSSSSHTILRVTPFGLPSILPPLFGKNKRTRARSKSDNPHFGIGETRQFATSSSSSAKEETTATHNETSVSTNNEQNTAPVDDATAKQEDKKDLSLLLEPTKGRVVRVACRLQPEGDFVPEPLIDGIVLHEDEPTVDLQFVLGWGNYLPGLHDLVSEMRIGETRSNISLDAGWGDRNPALVATISFEDSGMDQTQVKVGTQLYLAPQNLPCTVTNVTDTAFTIDANPPLAGASYMATVTLKDVQEGPIVDKYISDPPDSTSPFEVMTVALGCFWGSELAFLRIPGVVGTAVGYTQGHVVDPTYQQVCSGTTGHTEAILVVYDPTKASYETLVDVAMDRLGENKYLLNQVGNDKGTQYRHGVYYHTPAQEVTAKKVVESFGADCVTECKPADVFYFAEDYHQQYLLKGGQSARKGDTTVIRCYG